MYKVKPFENFDLNNIKLPDTMYKMAPVYGKSFATANKQTGGDHQESRIHVNNSLDIQIERLSNLNLITQSIEVIIQLACTSSLLDFLTKLKSELNDSLNVRIFRHCSLSHQGDDQLLKRWFSLTSSTSHQANYSLQIILKSSDFDQACLFKSDSNFKVTGEIKILALLNGLINSSMSVQVNDLNGLVHKLLLDEYLDYLQQSINTKQVDQTRTQYYKSNLAIENKVLDLAELIYKNQMVKN